MGAGDDASTYRFAPIGKKGGRRPKWRKDGCSGGALSAPEQSELLRYEAGCADPKVAACVVLAAAFEGEAAEDEDGSEGEEGEVAAEWGANVVADVVDGEDVVVDNAFDEVEGRPSPSRSARPVGV